MIAAAVLALVAGTSVNARAQGDRGRQGGPPRPPTPAEQHQRVVEQQHRTDQYRQHLDQQVHVVQQQTVQLQAQKRAAAARAQQEYLAQLRVQQEHLRAPHDFTHDPFVTAVHTYRYVINGTPREVGEPGVGVLRQAVNYGYQEGYRAGAADRADHWRSGYQSSPAYVDANFGYEGMYIDQADYNYYFRQGFQRGYQDGFANHYQYGSYSNGTYIVGAAVLAGILGLALIH
jgi:hypothetical protein